MFDEERLPLYIKNNKITNNYNSFNKSQNSITSPKQIDNNKKSKINSKNKEISDEKKLIKLKATNKLVISIYNFINILFNNKNKKIILFFFILILAGYIEYFIDKFIDIFALKIAMSILFLIPYLIIILDNETFFQLNSDFELNFLVFMKLIILLNKKMNFLEIILLSINANLFKSVFIKKMHVKQYFYSLDGYIDKLSYKTYIFESEIYFIILGFIINIISLKFLLKREKFSFYLFDEIVFGISQNCNSCYFFLFEYLMLRKFIKYLIRYFFIYDNRYKSKDKTKIIYITFFIFATLQIFFLNIFYKSKGEKILNLFFILLIIFIY
jgi:hypothetical protein